MENIVAKDIERVLISEDQLQARIAELAEQISLDYADKDPIFVGVLKGVIVFFADFIKRVKIPCTMGFFRLSSYAGGTCSTGKVEMKHAAGEDMKGRNVVILEDIYDSGRSLKSAYEYVLSQEPASVKICTLLDKPEGRLPGMDVKVDYTGFVIPKEFVVGYGLDYQEHYRNLPYVGVLKPEVYEK